MGISDRLKQGFVAGIILVAPLAVTLLLFQVLVRWSMVIIDPIVEGTRLANYTGNVPFLASGLAALLIIVTITLLGLFAQLTSGRRAFGSIGRLVHLVPLVSTVYFTVRQVADSIVERESRYESVVLIEYPREGMYLIGLVTGKSPSAVEAHSGEVTYNVFIPNSPNPTGGRLLFVPDSRIYETEMSVRKGLRLIVTTGMGTDADHSTLPPIDEDQPAPSP